MWRFDLGAQIAEVNGVRGVQFRVWAPRAQTVEVETWTSSDSQGSASGRAPRISMIEANKTSTPLVPAGQEPGVFEGHVASADAGTRYSFRLDGNATRPDPRSRAQPEGVHGPSEVVDPSTFRWTDQAWRGRPLEEYVIYELHVGTFTPEGTFDAVLEKLDHLKSIGVTAIELMPVAQCPGDRNWGYDGVDLFAPQWNYGGPDGLKRLVDGCHRAGFAVILDVVYNHLGPEGNYLSAFGPYFTDRYRTPWGDALNFDGPGSDPVRRFFVDNVLHWITEYHFDALRLDAIHGIFDFGAVHILEEIEDAVQREARELGRSCFIIAESDLNDPRIVSPVERGGYAVDTQWSDDFHHAVHTRLTGTRRGYFVDFGDLNDIAKAISDGFVYDGQYSKSRERKHGRSSQQLLGKNLVSFVQNHDQVANGSAGDRISRLMCVDRQKVAAGLLLCAPHLPMFFMGQEWGTKVPFLYFTSHTDPNLAEAVRAGRAREFASFGRTFPDPQSQESFESSKLDWKSIEAGEHAAHLKFYRDLMETRRRHASLHNVRKDLTRVHVVPIVPVVPEHASDAEATCLLILRRDPTAPSALCIFNVGDEPQPVFPSTLSSLALVHGSKWSLIFSSDDDRYGERERDRTASAQRSVDTGRQPIGAVKTFHAPPAQETDAAKPLCFAPPNSFIIYLEER